MSQLAINCARPRPTLTEDGTKPICQKIELDTLAQAHKLHKADLGLYVCRPMQVL